MFEPVLDRSCAPAIAAKIARASAALIARHSLLVQNGVEIVLA
jgi:hypothetical protein